MPRPKPIIATQTVDAIRHAVLDSLYPVTARQVRETTGRSDQTVRTVLTWLVESDEVAIDRSLTPIHYYARGARTVHGSVWTVLYREINDHADIKLEQASTLARRIVELIEDSGVTASQELNDETAAREQVESRKRK